jgi:hypothetical protein
MLIGVAGHSGMVRQHQTRNLEIPGSRFARPGMTFTLSYPALPAVSRYAELAARGGPAKIPATGASRFLPELA